MEEHEKNQDIISQMAKITFPCPPESQIAKEVSRNIPRAAEKQKKVPTAPLQKLIIYDFESLTIKSLWN